MPPSSLPEAPPRAPYARAVWAVLWKDLRAEFRAKELLSAMLVFSLLVILIFSFALELDQGARASVAAGVIWVTFIFAGTLGFNRSLSQEKDRGSLDGLLLAPVDRSALYFGKLLGNLIFMGVVEAILLPVAAVLFNLPLLMPLLGLVVALGTVGYAAVGTLLASMVVHTRGRDVMLSILLFPVALPLLMAAVKASGNILAGAAWDQISPWLNLLVVYDVIFGAVALMLFEPIVEE